MLRFTRTFLRNTTGGFSLTFWWLWLGTLVNRLGSFVVPFLALYLTQYRGVSLTQAGLVLSLYGAGSVASGPAGGVLADRFGRRITMMAGLGVSGITLIALGFASGLPVIAPLVLFQGFVSELYRPAMQAAISDTVPDTRDQQRAFALIYWAINLGFAVGISAAGYLAAWDYRALFAVNGSANLLFAGIIAWRVPETRPAVTHGHGSGALTGLVAALSDRAYVPFLLVNLVLCLGFFMIPVTLPIDMASHGLSPTVFGSVIAVNGVVIVLLQPFAMRLVTRWPQERVLAAASVLFGLGFGMNGLARTAPVYAAAVAVWTLGEIANAPVSSALVAEIAPAELRGRYQGVFSMTWGMAAFIAPALGAFTMDRLGARGLWASCLVVGLLLAVAHLAIAPSRQRILAGRVATAHEGPAPARTPTAA